MAKKTSSINRRFLDPELMKKFLTAKGRGIGSEEDDMSIEEIAQREYEKKYGKKSKQGVESVQAETQDNRNEDDMSIEEIAQREYEKKYGNKAKQGVGGKKGKKLRQPTLNERTTMKLFEYDSPVKVVEYMKKRGIDPNYDEGLSWHDPTVDILGDAAAMIGNIGGYTAGSTIGGLGSLIAGTAVGGPGAGVAASVPGTLGGGMAGSAVGGTAVRSGINALGKVLTPHLAPDDWGATTKNIFKEEALMAALLDKGGLGSQAIKLAGKGLKGAGSVLRSAGGYGKRVLTEALEPALQGILGIDKQAIKGADELQASFKQRPEATLEAIEGIIKEGTNPDTNTLDAAAGTVGLKDEIYRKYHGIPPEVPKVVMPGHIPPPIPKESKGQQNALVTFYKTVQGNRQKHMNALQGTLKGLDTGSVTTLKPLTLDSLGMGKDFFKKLQNASGTEDVVKYINNKMRGITKGNKNVNITQVPLKPTELHEIYTRLQDSAMSAVGEGFDRRPVLEAAQRIRKRLTTLGPGVEKQMNDYAAATKNLSELKSMNSGQPWYRESGRGANRQVTPNTRDVIPKVAEAMRLGQQKSSVFRELLGAEDFLTSSSKGPGAMPPAIPPTPFLKTPQGQQSLKTKSMGMDLLFNPDALKSTESPATTPNVYSWLSQLGRAAAKPILNTSRRLRQGDDFIPIGEGEDLLKQMRASVKNRGKSIPKDKTGKVDALQQRISDTAGHTPKPVLRERTWKGIAVPPSLYTGYSPYLPIPFHERARLRPGGLLRTAADVLPNTAEYAGAYLDKPFTNKKSTLGTLLRQGGKRLYLNQQQQQQP